MLKVKSKHCTFGSQINDPWMEAEKPKRFCLFIRFQNVNIYARASIDDGNHLSHVVVSVELKRRTEKWL